jgi:hypothetical protein
LIPALQVAHDYEPKKPAEALVSSEAGTFQNMVQLPPDGFCLRLLGWHAPKIARILNAMQGV